MPRKESKGIQIYRQELYFNVLKQQSDTVKYTLENFEAVEIKKKGKKRRGGEPFLKMAQCLKQPGLQELI